MPADQSEQAGWMMRRHVEDVLRAARTAHRTPSALVLSPGAHEALVASFDGVAEAGPITRYRGVPVRIDPRLPPNGARLEW